MTYIYEGPSWLATIGIAVLSGAAFALVQSGMWRLQDWWDDRREEPGPVDDAVDGVPIEPRDDPPLTYAEGWTPSQEDVELHRALVRERFQSPKS